MARIGKYKDLLLSGLLMAYLAGTFQGPFLEGLHMLSHLAQEFRNHAQVTYVHTHEDGQQHAHRHLILETVDDALDRFSDDPVPGENQDKSLENKKKNPQQQSRIDPILLYGFPVPPRPLSNSYAVRSIFLTIPTPPPRRHFPTSLGEII